MAVSVLSNPVNYDMKTAAGAHAYMLALHNHLTKVGLARVMTGNDYNLDGDGTQLPTTYTETSGWLAYNFTDAAQSNYPITVWFRLVRGRWGSANASAEAWGTQYRVSEGVVGGVPQGANFETFDGVSSPVAGSSESNSFNNALGDFVRYDGNSLTVLLGINGWVSSYGSYRSSLLELHIERRYFVAGGAVGRGFCGWFSPGGPVIAPPPQWVTAGYPNYSSYTATLSRPPAYVSSAEGTNVMFTDAHVRPTAAPLLSTGGAAIVMPVMFLDPDTKPTVASKLFTAPYANFSPLAVTTLDFTGTNRKYLAYRPVTSNIGNTVLTYLFEWE